MIDITNESIMMDLSKLPKDIIRRIIPYTYHTQDPKLLRDIVHYVHSKNKIIRLYLRTWNHLAENEPPEHEQWIVNDIFSFIYHAAILKHSASYYFVIMRIWGVKRMNEVDRYVEWFHTIPIRSQLNIIWGLLREDERVFILEEHTAFSNGMGIHL